MKNSIYTTTAGMLTSAERLNVAANNLANVSTNGYKEDIPFEQTIRFYTEGPFPGKDQPVLAGTVANMEQGVVKHTGQELDLAFQGTGYFSVQGPNNETYYTRDGAFTLNSNKELVTQGGLNVLDKFDRKITVVGDKLNFTPSGDVYVDDNYYTTLKIIDSPNRDDIEKVGVNFIKIKDSAQQPTQMENPSLTVGALEKSNVNTMNGMAEMIQTQRTFDLQKTAADIMLKIVRKSITELAKPI